MAAASRSALLPLPLARRWAQLERAGIVLVVLLVFLLPPALREFGIGSTRSATRWHAVLPWAFHVLFVCRPAPGHAHAACARSPTSPDAA